MSRSVQHALKCSQGCFWDRWKVLMCKFSISLWHCSLFFLCTWRGLRITGTQSCSIGNYVRKEQSSTPRNFYYKWVSHKSSQLHQLPCRRGRKVIVVHQPPNSEHPHFSAVGQGRKNWSQEFQSPSTTTITTLYLQITRSIRFTTNNHVHLTLG